MWALHALSMVVDLAGPLYHSHLEASFTLVLRLLHSTPHTHVEVQQSLSRCLNALITSMGPDLQGAHTHLPINTLSSCRWDLYTLSSLWLFNVNCLQVRVQVCVRWGPRVWWAVLWCRIVRTVWSRPRRSPASSSCTCLRHALSIWPAWCPASVYVINALNTQNHTEQQTCSKKVTVAVFFLHIYLFVLYWRKMNVIERGEGLRAWLCPHL